ISLYLQPVQDLTVDSAISRAEYQVVLEDASTSELNAWVPKLIDQRNKEPGLRNVPSNFVDRGLSANVVIDRDTAARFGITAATIDNALYDAYGQRIVSTIFTQSNQYRVILEASPDIQNSVGSLNDVYLPSAGGGQGPRNSSAKISDQAG